MPEIEVGFTSDWFVISVRPFRLKLSQRVVENLHLNVLIAVVDNH